VAQSRPSKSVVEEIGLSPMGDLPGSVKRVELVRLSVGNAGEDRLDDAVIELDRFRSCILVVSEPSSRDIPNYE
jgi:hypothetical protein